MQESQPSPVLPEPKWKSRRNIILPLAILSFGLFPVGIITNYYFPSFAFNNVLILVVVLTFLIAPILGISAELMAIRDLRRIRAGTVPASALGVTKLGQTLGIFGALGDSLVLFVFLLQIFSFAGIPPGKDSLTNDLNNLFANAYQYRIRPLSMRGGDGSYTGYKIPTVMSKNENGFYTARVLHADTIQFTAKWLADSTSTITVKLGPDGRAIEPWTFHGDFK
jgi:hypothetical protein